MGLAPFVPPLNRTSLCVRTARKLKIAEPFVPEIAIGR